MFSCLGLPAILIRAAIELGLVAVAVFVVLPKHRTAGLVLACGSGLSLLMSVGVPIAEIAGFGMVVQGSGGSSNGLEAIGVFMFMLTPFLGPLAQAVNLTLIGVAVVMLCNRLPDEERDWSGTPDA